MGLPLPYYFLSSCRLSSVILYTRASPPPFTNRHERVLSTSSLPESASKLTKDKAQFQRSFFVGLADIYAFSLRSRRHATDSLGFAATIMIRQGAQWFNYIFRYIIYFLIFAIAILPLFADAFRFLTGTRWRCCSLVFTFMLYSPIIWWCCQPFSSAILKVTHIMAHSIIPLQDFAYGPKAPSKPSDADWRDFYRMMPSRTHIDIGFAFHDYYSGSRHGHFHLLP